MSRLLQEIVLKVNPNRPLDRIILNGEYQHIDHIISITAYGQFIHFQFNPVTRILLFVGTFLPSVNMPGGYNIDSIKIKYYSFEEPLENSNYEEWIEE